MNLRLKQDLRHSLSTIKQLLRRLDLAVARRLCRTRLGASTYYYLFSPAFRLEHRAVLVGRVNAVLKAPSAGRNSYLLRRGIHRIEKGLLMKPRREVFAESYLLDTVRAFVRETERLLGGWDRVDATEALWAQSVLRKYFATVSKRSSVVRQSFSLFESVRPIPDEKDRSPYPFGLVPSSRVSYDDLLGFVTSRHSVRWFEDRSVSRDLVDRAIRAAATTPSACNRQPFRYAVTVDPSTASSIGAIPMGTKGFSENFPALAVIVGDLSAYSNERDRHVIYVDAALSAMTFVYALQSQGVSSCVVNWPDIAERELIMSRRLGLKPFERVVMVVAFGYADPTGLVAYSQKKPVEMLISYIEDAR